MLNGADETRWDRKDNAFLADWRLQRVPCRAANADHSQPREFNTFNNANNVNPLTTPALFNFVGSCAVSVIRRQLAVSYVLGAVCNSIATKARKDTRSSCFVADPRSSRRIYEIASRPELPWTILMISRHLGARSSAVTSSTAHARARRHWHARATSRGPECGPPSRRRRRREDIRRGRCRSSEKVRLDAVTRQIAVYVARLVADDLDETETVAQA